MSGHNEGHELMAIKLNPRANLWTFFCISYPTNGPYCTR